MDYEYLCENLGHLSGLQTRVYEGNTLLYCYRNVEFSPDPVQSVLERIYACTRTLYYTDTAHLYFGALKIPADNRMLIIGPSFRIQPSREQKLAILHELGEPQRRLPELTGYLESTPGYPLESFLEILCFLNYALNGEKITVLDLLQQDMASPIPLPLPQPVPIEEEFSGADIHNTFLMEKKLLSHIAAGQVQALQQMFAQPPTGRAGRIAHDDVRQAKNTLICTATLASRAAIEGGLSQHTAFSLSDLYIQKAELLNDTNTLSVLGMRMLLDFATRVEGMKCAGKSKLVTSVMRYINANLDKKLTTGEIASALGMNRTYLCKVFQQKSGRTLVDFITDLKLEEAKRLLHITDKPVARISDDLAFSSQSYFQNVFKKQTGMTPKQYRET